MLLKDDLKIGYGQVMWTKLHFPYQQKLTLITGTENGVQSTLYTKRVYCIPGQSHMNVIIERLSVFP